jgi:hypothetical protein
MTRFSLNHRFHMYSNFATQPKLLPKMLLHNLIDICNRSKPTSLESKLSEYLMVVSKTLVSMFLLKSRFSATQLQIRIPFQKPTQRWSEANSSRTLELIYRQTQENNVVLRSKIDPHNLLSCFLELFLEAHNV